MRRRSFVESVSLVEGEMVLVQFDQLQIDDPSPVFINPEFVSSINPSGHDETCTIIHMGSGLHYEVVCDYDSVVRMLKGLPPKRYISHKV